MKADYERHMVVDVTETEVERSGCSQTMDVQGELIVSFEDDDPAERLPLAIVTLTAPKVGEGIPDEEAPYTVELFALLPLKDVRRLIVFLQGAEQKMRAALKAPLKPNLCPQCEKKAASK